jgi:hypothetical protein
MKHGHTYTYALHAKNILKPTVERLNDYVFKATEVERTQI